MKMTALHRKYRNKGKKHTKELAGSRYTLPMKMIIYSTIKTPVGINCNWNVSATAVFNQSMDSVL